MTLPEQLAAASNKVKSLIFLLDTCKRQRMNEQMDLVDGQGERRTAMMMAAANGFTDCVQELLDAGANRMLKCSNNLTAEQYASKRGHKELAALIARGGEPESDSEEDEDNGLEETSGERRRRIKLERQAKEAGRTHLVKKAEEGQEKEEEEEEEETEAPVKEADLAAKWEEVAQAKQSGSKELIVERTDAAQEAEVDPALWQCSGVNMLRLRVRALATLPEDLGRLSNLVTLIVSDNAFVALPDALGQLSALKNLEANGNRIKALPEGISKLANLEVLQMAGNQLSSAAPLAPLANLVSVGLDGNKLATLDELDLANKPRLQILSARSNGLEAIPTGLGECQALTSLFLSGNEIEELPVEMGGLKEKKMREIELQENPLNDPKIKKMIGKSANLVKELLTYVRKNGFKGDKGGKKGKGKNGKKKAESEAEEEEEEEDQPEEENPVPAPSEQEAAATGGASETNAEVLEEVDLSKLSKKARQKAQRKMLDAKMQALCREQDEKRAEEDRIKAEAEALRAAAEAREAAEKSKIEAMGNSDKEDDEERPTNIYAALSPEQQAELEAQEAARLRAKKEALEEEEAARCVSGPRCLWLYSAEDVPHLGLLWLASASATEVASAALLECPCLRK